MIAIFSVAALIAQETRSGSPLRAASSLMKSLKIQAGRSLGRAQVKSERNLQAAINCECSPSLFRITA
jgi:hypothetical protein